MLNKRRTTHILLLINLALILFVIIRAGSADIVPKSRVSEPLTIRLLEQPANAAVDTLILNDFEKANDLMNMYDQGGEYSLSLSGEYSTHRNSSLLIEKVPESNIELATVHFPRKWELYDAFELDIYNDSDSEGTVWLRVGNQYDARRFYIRSQKFSRAYPLSPGANTVIVTVDDIAKAFGRLPKRKSLHLNFPPGGGERYFLDYMRMVRHDDANQ